jgi:hypothetical protein
VTKVEELCHFYKKDGAPALRERRLNFSPFFIRDLLISRRLKAFCIWYLAVSMLSTNQTHKKELKYKIYNHIGNTPFS